MFEYNSSNQILAQYTNSNISTDDVLSENITAAGVTAKLAQSPGTFTFLKDSIGSIVDIADSNGNEIQHYVYSAFGSIIGIQDANAADISANPVVNSTYGFAGREFDQETGFYFNRARNFDPKIGRFIQEDKSSGNPNLPISVVNSYVYGANNPANATDPTGNDIVDTVIASITKTTTSFATAILGPLMSFSSNFTSGLGSGQGFWKALAAGTAGLLLAVGAIVAVIAIVASWGVLAGIILAPVIGAAASFLNNAYNQAMFHPGNFSWGRALQSGGTAALIDFEAMALSGWNPVVGVAAGGVGSFTCVDNGVDEIASPQTPYCAFVTFSF